MSNATAFTAAYFCEETARPQQFLQDAGRGLSGIVEAQLGISLDKSLQCSSWGTRPLSPEQLKYASLDAAVLLMLLDSIIASALPSKALPALVTEGRHSATADASAAPSEHTLEKASASMPAVTVSEHTGKASSARSQGLHQLTAAESTVGQHLQSTRSPGVLAGTGASSQDSLHSSGQDADQQREENSLLGPEETIKALAALSLNSTQSAAPQPAASAAELQEAAAVWGTRLEVGGSLHQKPQRPSRVKGSGLREQFRQDAASSEHIGKRPPHSAAEQEF